MFDDRAGLGEAADVFAVPSSALPAPTRSFADAVAARDAARAAELDEQRVASPPVAALIGAVEGVLAQVPAELPGPQALTDTALLLGQVERLRAGLLSRIADVQTRKLYVLDGAGSATTWVQAQHTSLDRGQVALARRMSALPTLDAAVHDGQLSIAGAERVGKALAKLRRHLDRTDGLIDGQDGEQALIGVIGHGVPSLVLQSLGGLADDDPRVQQLRQDCAAIVETRRSQQARLEAAFVLLARHLEPGLLPGALCQVPGSMDTANCR